MKNTAEADRIQSKLIQISHMHFSRVFQQFGSLGVHPGQCGMLWILRQEDGLSQSELAKRLKIKPSTVTVSIRRMEKAGLLERRADREDMRRNRIYLTDHAKNILEKAKKIFDENEKIMTEGSSEAEQCLLLRLLNQIIENLERAAPSDEENYCRIKPLKEEKPYA